MQNSTHINNVTLDQFAPQRKWSALRVYILIQAKYSGNIHDTIKSPQVAELATFLNNSKSNIQRILRQLIKMGVVKRPTVNWYHRISWRHQPNVIIHKPSGKPLKNYVFDVDIDLLCSKDGLRYLRAIYYQYLFTSTHKYARQNKKQNPLNVSRIKAANPTQQWDKQRLRTSAEISSSFLQSVHHLQHVSLSTISRWGKKAAEFGLIEIFPQFSYFKCKTLSGKLTPLFFNTIEQAQAKLLSLFRNHTLDHDDHWKINSVITTNSFNNSKEQKYTIVQYLSNIVCLVV